MLFLLLIQSLAQSSPPAAASSPLAALDTTVAVGASTQLRLEASAGRLNVRVWDRNAVHIIASPSVRTTVRLAITPTLVTITGAASTGVDEAEYQLTVPRRMTMTLGSGDLAMEINGAEGDIVARNYSGRMSISRTKGSVSLRSVLGEVEVRNSTGRLSAQVLNAPIRLTDVSGDVELEGSANHLYLTRVDSKSIRASTVNGVIWFTGPLNAGGRYAFSTHAGSVFLSVVEPVNATLHVSSVSGAFASAFPFNREEGPRRGRFTATIGNGSANVDVETFNGGIVVRPSDATPKAP